MLLLSPSKTAHPTGTRASSGYELLGENWRHAGVSNTKW